MTHAVQMKIPDVSFLNLFRFNKYAEREMYKPFYIT
jgi:hypothetical protein